MQKYVNIMVSAMLLLGLYLASLYSYPLFHGIAEAFSIVIACGIFMVAWNSRRLMENNYLLFIGIAYLFVGCIDFIHTLAYKGMGVFRGFDANLPTQLWIAGRYMESMSLFIAPLFFKRRFHAYTVVGIYCCATAAIIASVFFLGVFPDCFIEGRGLTPFKVTSEYIISFLLICSIFVLLKYRDRFDIKVLRLIIWSIIITVVSELMFTFYISVYGISNLIGHYCKILSFYLMYRAIIVTGLENPYSLLLKDLKSSEERFKNLAENSQDLIYRMSLTDGRYEYLSPAFRKIFGYTVEEAFATPMLIRKLIHPDWQGYFDKEWENIVAGEVPASYEYCITDKKGRMKWIYQRNTLIKDEKGTPVALEGIATDITGRKEMEEKLRASEILLNTTGRMAKVGGWEVDAETLDVRWTDEVYRIHEVPLDYKPPLDEAINFFHPEDRKILSKAIREALDHGTPYDLELRFVSAKGKRLWTHTICQPKIVDGRVVSLNGAFQDITDRKNIEIMLNNSEKKFRSISELAHDAIIMMDVSGAVTYWNKAAEKIFGYADDEMIGRELHAALAPRRYCESYMKGLDHFKTTGTGNAIGKTLELSALRKDGIEFPIELSLSAVYLEGNLFAVGIARDITGRKKAEEALFKEKKRVSTLSDNAPFALILIDHDGNFTYVNPKFKELFGYDLPDVPSVKTWFEKAYPDPEYRKMVVSAWTDDFKNRRSGQRRPRVFDVTCKDGSVKVIEFITVEVETGEYIVSCEDITQQKQLEEQLRTMSIIDDLTGLYNRRGFFTLAQQQTKTAQRTKRHMLLFFADLDKMKWINDTLGHQEGDRALVDTAAILKETFRESDIIGRMGGDEFAVLAINTTGDTADMLAKRLHTIIEAHNEREERGYAISLSTGIAYYDPENPSPLDTLMAQADEMMYKSKKGKRNG